MGSLGLNGLSGDAINVTSGTFTGKSAYGGGYGQSLADSLSTQFYNWEFGVKFSYPLGNRSAKSKLSASRLETAKLMKQAGCDITGFGIESGNDELLKQMKKGAKKENILNAIKIMKQVKIRTCAFFIFGHPNETYKSIFDSIKFASKVNCEEVAIGIMVPYTGTEIYNMALKGEGGYVKMSIDWDDYNKQLGNAVELKNISRRKLELLQLAAYFWLYVVNGRWADIYKLFTSSSNRGNNVWKLIISIFVKIIDPSQRITKKWFTNSKFAKKESYKL